METTRLLQEIALKCSTLLIYPISRYYVLNCINFSQTTNLKREKLTAWLAFVVTQRVLNDWSAAFFTIFQLGPLQLDGNSSKVADKWVSIDEYLDGYLVERKNRYGKNMEVIDVGMQEIKTYFRLFLLSSVLLMFMFCSRIAKSKYSRNSIPVNVMP